MLFHQHAPEQNIIARSHAAGKLFKMEHRNHLAEQYIQLMYELQTHLAIREIASNQLDFGYSGWTCILHLLLNII